MASLDLDKKKALGRGLASLIPDAKTESGTTINNSKKEYFLCDIEKIVPNTYQPRKIFQKEALEELVESVKVHGIIQPLVVRQRDGHFELIAGERRWRAAQKAGLKQVPVVVKELTGDAPSLEMAIVENVQRSDLNCIEEAIAYQQMADEFQLSQEEIASRVGKNRATIANTMRLLKLPAVIREDITSGKITMGHARTLLSLDSPQDQLLVRELILKKKLSVRDTERKVNEILRAKDQPEGQEKKEDANIRAFEEDLKRRYAAPVRVVGKMDRGFIQISYSSKQEFLRISDMLLGLNDPQTAGPVTSNVGAPEIVTEIHETPVMDIPEDSPSHDETHRESGGDFDQHDITDGGIKLPPPLPKMNAGIEGSDVPKTT